jgi:hypothetical protein
MLLIMRTLFEKTELELRGSGRAGRATENTAGGENYARLYIYISTSNSMTAP